jgi:hypothetical protein
MDIRVPAFPRQTVAQVLDTLNPVVLIPLMGNLSRTVNSGVVRSRALAAALQAAGAQRLSDLQSAAPRMRATLDKLAARLPSVHLSVEEITLIRAVVELYLGLVLQWLEAIDRPRPNSRELSRRIDWPHLFFLPVHRAHRTRIGVLLPPSTSVF